MRGTPPGSCAGYVVGASSFARFGIVDDMRISLMQLAARQRYEFTARVGRAGTRPGRRGKPVATLLLLDVALAGAAGVLTSHTWLDRGSWAKSLVAGDRIVFTGRLRQYRKLHPATGLVDIDLGLTVPRMVTKVEDQAAARSQPARGLAWTWAATLLLALEWRLWAGEFRATADVVGYLSSDIPCPITPGDIVTDIPVELLTWWPPVDAADAAEDWPDDDLDLFVSLLGFGLGYARSMTDELNEALLETVEGIPEWWWLLEPGGWTSPVGGEAT